MFNVSRTCKVNTIFVVNPTSNFENPNLIQANANNGAKRRFKKNKFFSNFLSFLGYICYDEWQHNAVEREKMLKTLKKNQEMTKKANFNKFEFLSLFNDDVINKFKLITNL